LISAKTIESYVETKSSTCREVFSSLIENESPTTQKALKEIVTQKIVKYAKSAGLTLSSNWRKDLSEVLTIEDLFLIVEAENHKEAQGYLYRFLRVFRTAINVPLGYVLDVNLNALPVNHQMEAGDGIFLAALYKAFDQSKD